MRPGEHTAKWLTRRTRMANAIKTKKTFGTATIDRFSPAKEQE